MAMAPNGSDLYAAYNSGVIVVDTASDTVGATITSPSASLPGDLAVSPDGTKVSVGNFDSNNLSVVDTATDTVSVFIRKGQSADNPILAA